MSLKEVISKFLNEMDTSDISEKFFHGDFSFAPTKWDSKKDESFREQLKALGLTKAESVESYGGEGMGDTFYDIFEFSNGKDSVFVQFDGWYQSYNGSEFTEWFFVEPVVVTKTEYVRAK